MQKYEHAFGKNDIRGIYGEDITEELFYNTGIGFVEWLKEQSGKKTADMWITITRDARLHSPALEKALADGITSTGANVINLGLAPTPIGYYSEVVGVEGYDVIAAAIITASHNPSQYNGLKMTHEHQTLNEEQIKDVKALTEAEYRIKSPITKEGELKEYDLIPDYIKEMKGEFSALTRLIHGNIKVVVDSANGTGGIVAPALYRSIGCNVIELYSNPDGKFPNHHPNPSDEKTLNDIKRAVVENGADIGIAFDGDSDRIGVIDSKGNSMSGDKLLLIYALDLIEKYEGTGVKPVVVSEVKCSQVLFDTINKEGGEAIMCRTGHGYIKAKMKETNALLGGEMSGHTFFKDKYYGFDDAVYAGCRIIEILSKNKKQNPSFKIEDLLTPFNKVFTSQEVRLECPNELKKPALEMLKGYVNNHKDMFGSEIKDIITIDGMRVVFDGGFALIRQSNTEPVFTLRFEAKTQDECERFENVMVSQIKKCIEESSKEKV